jgi:hypothetical protein
MTPERLTAWIYKTVPGGTRLSLVNEQALTGGGTTITSWTREEVDEARENPVTGMSIAEQLLEAALDHADNLGEPARFLVQWLGREAQPLRSMIHRCNPTTPAEARAAMLGTGGQDLQSQGQLLNHIAQQQKVLTGSIGVILNACERTMSMQQRIIEQMAHRLDAVPPPAADQNEEVTRAKIRAFEKLAELAPDVARLAIVAAQRALGGGDETPPSTNGAS